MDETVQMVAEFFRAFKMEVPDRPSVPLPNMDDEDRLMQLSEDMERIAERCWGLARRTADKRIAGLFLRLQLIQEETAELAAAMASADLREYLDAMSDLQYVVDNAYVAFGLRHLKMPAFREVHLSNMSKLTADGKPIFDEAGRVQKSDQFRVPDFNKVLEEDRCEESSTDACSEDSSGQS